MVSFVCPEYSKGFPVEIWMPQSPGLDDRPDMGRLGLELALQDSG